MKNKTEIEKVLDYCLSLSPNEFEKKGLYWCTTIKEEEFGFWYSWSDWGDSFFIQLSGVDIYRSSDNDYYWSFFSIPPSIDVKIKKLCKELDKDFEIGRGKILKDKLSKILS